MDIVFKPDDMPFNELHDELVEHYKNDKNFKGFLLTLNNEEFSYIKGLIGKFDKLQPFDKKCRDLSLICIINHFKRFPSNGERISLWDFEDEINFAINDISLISLNKKGYVKLEAADNDDDWKIILTKKGKEEGLKGYENYE